MLDPQAMPVFAYYFTIFFDNMAPPWGIRWRKCDPRGPADAPSTLPRRSLDAPSMFPEASKKRAKKTLIIGCLFGSILAPFGLQIRSILASFFASVFEQVFEALFLILVPFPTPRTLNFDALVQAPCDFSSFRHAAKNIKKTSKSLQHGF